MAGCDIGGSVMESLHKEGVVDSAGNIINVEKFHAFERAYSTTLAKTAASKGLTSSFESFFYMEVVPLAEGREFTYRASIDRNAAALLEEMGSDHIEIDDLQETEHIFSRPDQISNDMSQEMRQVSISINTRLLLNNINFQISQSEKRLRQIASLLKVKRMSANERIGLLAEQERVLRRLHGNRDMKVRGLYALRRQMNITKSNENKITFGIINSLYIEDMNYVNEILSNNDNKSLEEIQEARNVLRIWSQTTRGLSPLASAAGKTQENPVFSEGFLSALEDNDPIRDEIRRFAGKADEMLIAADNMAKHRIVRWLNSVENFRKANGNVPFDVDNVFQAVADIKLVDREFMETTSGMFSETHVLNALMMRMIQENEDRILVVANRLSDKVGSVVKAAESKIKRMGATWDIYRSRSANGKMEDRFISPFTSKWDDTVGKYLGGYTNQIRGQAGGMSNKRHESANTMRLTFFQHYGDIIDIRALPEVRNYLMSELTEEAANKMCSRVNSGYAAQLRNQLGDKLYEEIVAQQLEMVKSFMDKYRVGAMVASNAPQNIIDEAMMAKLSEISDEYDATNNPFVACDVVLSGRELKESHPFFTYNVIIPKPELKNMYDTRFKTISDSPELYEMYKAAKEMLTFIHGNMPNELGGFGSLSLPGMKKQALDLLEDKAVRKSMKNSPLYARMYAAMMATLTEEEQSRRARFKTHPLTGEPIDVVSKPWLDSHKQEMAQRIKIRMESAMPAIPEEERDGIRLGRKKIDITDPKYKTLMEHLAPEFGLVAGTQKDVIAHLKKEFPDVDLTNCSVTKLMEEAIIDQLIKEEKFDFPMLLNFYGRVSALSSARESALGNIQEVKKQLFDIDAATTTNSGALLNDDNSGVSRTVNNGKRLNAMAQVEQWYQRVVLQRTHKKGLKDTFRQGKTGIVDLRNKKLEDAIDEMIGDKVKSMMTHEEKNMLKACVDGYTILQQEVDRQKEMYDNGEIEKDTLEDRLEDLEQRKLDLYHAAGNIGVVMSTTAMMESFLKLTRFTGLALNAGAAAMNYLEGQAANSCMAAQGIFFNEGHLHRANQIVLHARINTMPFAKDGVAKKIRAIVTSLGVIQDTMDELRKAEIKTNPMKRVDPFILNQMTEYVNQCPVVIACLLNTTIVAKDGKTMTSVWDAFNEEGKLKEEYRTERNIATWEDHDSDRFADVKSRINAAIRMGHGNYSRNHPIKMTDNMLGTVMMNFKHWYPQAIRSRFGVVQNDYEAGIHGYKGRIRSLTKGSAPIYAGVIGMLIGGPILAGVMGGIGMGLATWKGQRTSNSIIKDLGVTCLELTRCMVLSPLRIFGVKNSISAERMMKRYGIRSDSKQGDYVMTGRNFNQMDAANMSANIKMLSKLVWITGMIFLLQALAASIGDDDDDNSEEGIFSRLFGKAGVVAVINMLGQFTGQMTSWINPVAAWDQITNVGAVGKMRKMIELATAISNAANGEAYYTSGDKYGQSIVADKAAMAFLPGMLRTDFGLQTTQVRNPSFITKINGLDAGESTARRKMLSENARNKYLDELD